MGVMGWGYKVYIVGALAYKFIKDFAQPRGRYGNAVIFGGGDFAVLTKNTAEAATAEKDRAAPLCAAYYGFFPKMQRGAGNTKDVAFFTKSDPFCAVGIAAARTDLTVTHFALL